MYKVKKQIANHMFKRFTFSKAIYILKGNSVTNHMVIILYIQRRKLHQKVKGAYL